MSFPIEWKSKPMIAAYPYSTHDQIVCHNCYVSWPKDHMNPCTGLCRKCIEENPTPTKEARQRRSGEREEHECRKCLQLLIRTNFGVSRDVCEECKPDQPLRQRCLSCDRYQDDCWNNICSTCRTGKVLCENVGHFYASFVRHDRECWCVWSKKSNC